MRKSMQLIILMTTLCIAIFFLVMSIRPVPAQTAQSRSFTDRNGSFAGSSVTRGNSTTFTDRNGRFDGTVIRNSDGTTSLYDRNGHFTGSSTNTTQPR